MTLKELSKMTARAATAECFYESYRWDVEPTDILKLLVERETFLDIISQALAKCNPSGPVALLLLSALETAENTWPSGDSGSSLD